MLTRFDLLKQREGSKWLGDVAINLESILFAKCSEAYYQKKNDCIDIFVPGGHAFTVVCTTNELVELDGRLSGRIKKKNRL